jgi:hypothetical protein
MQACLEILLFLTDKKMDLKLTLNKKNLLSRGSFYTNQRAVAIWTMHSKVLKIFDST